LFVDNELRLWGINPNGPNKEHRLFMKLATEEVVAEFNGSIRFDSSKKLMELPNDQTDAISFLLNQMLIKQTDDGRRQEFSEITDMIEETHGCHLPYPPYYHRNGGSLALNGGYKNIDGISLGCEELDPLKRFKYTPIAPEDDFMNKWSSKPNGYEWLPYHIAEAALIHDIVEKGHACISCCQKHTLAFNASIDSTFSNIFCTSCKSTYTFIGKSGVDKIEKILEKGKVDTGRSFGRYQKEKSLLACNAKMYAVLVACGDGWKRWGLNAYAVQIIGALPNVGSKTFNRFKIRFSSRLIISPSNMNLRTSKWFQFRIPPTFDCDKASFQAINSFFEGLSMSEHCSAGAIPNETETVHHPVSRDEREDPKTLLRSLKRKRNEIEQIQRRSSEGEELDENEAALLSEYGSIIKKIDELTEMLY
jgi:hypothetical protein